ncbi:hypothetical protein T12_7487 [Trichinella patagoniensis]|uniref:Uncharacterized protein n=1 Tax=Trichinella patagoniensis TaxID=990121 RepID=A0A0V0ZNW1_9BILA|nr:hypothetical protein T12_7487 [Trichinella patagoniensis]
MYKVLTKNRRSVHRPKFHAGVLITRNRSSTGQSAARKGDVVLLPFMFVGYVGFLVDQEWRCAL